MSSKEKASRRMRVGGESLGRQLAERLRARIMAGEFPPGTRLPSEAAITDDYGLSRVTVRTAIKLLESQGLVDVRHGSGTFVCDFGGGVRAGLQELRSMSESVRDMGMTTETERHVAERRKATALEAAKLQITTDDDVIYLERAVRADGELVSFSYETIVDIGFSKKVLDQIGRTSIFADMDKLGVRPVRALAEVHAVSSQDIGWGSDRPKSGLYVELEQVHFERRGQPVIYSHTYFVEGRFQFVILRTR